MSAAEPDPMLATRAGSSPGGAPAAPEVALSGMPAADSPTMAALVAKLRAAGWWALVAAPVVVPGAAPADDLLVRALTSADRATAVGTAAALLRAHLAAVEDLRRVAATAPAGLRAVVLVDGGLLDLAQLSDAELTVALRQVGLDHAAALDRHAAAVTLVTEGGHQGQRWWGHPHLMAVADQGDAEMTACALTRTILAMLGDPEPLEIERKFLVQEPTEIVAGAVPVEISQQYLQVAPGMPQERVRSRTALGRATFWHTTKSPSSSSEGARVEVEEQISERGYLALIASRSDSSRAVVVKRRWSFVHAGQHFELDQFSAPRALWLLEAEVLELTQPVMVPGWLSVIEEVSGDPRWSNAAIAAAH